MFALLLKINEMITIFFDGYIKYVYRLSHLGYDWVGMMLRMRLLYEAKRGMLNSKIHYRC